MKKKLTLQDLADKLTIDRQYVWNIEKGKVNFTIDYLDKIALALEVPQNEFIITNN